MRKLLSFVALLLACMLLPVMAQADSLYEWNRSCRRKTICETKVYSIGDETRLIATIPANTYVKVHGQYKWAEISYKTSSGQSGRGLADPACIGSAVIFFTDANGDRRGIQELQYYEMYGKNPPPGGVLDKPLPGGNGETVGEPVSKGNAETTDKTTTSTSTSTTKKSSSTKTTTTKTATSDVNTDVLWQDELISVKTWGFHSSVILVDGKEQIVPTDELTFSADVPVGKRIASILAPRTGKCSLREKASDKADVIKKCKAGTVVQVLEYGWKYCRIVYDGKTGYVLTACLTFLDSSEEIMGKTVLTYNGKATGNAQVPIRNTASSDSAIIVKRRSGTEVTVLGKTGKWYEIACEGWHGFVHQNYMSFEIE